jgi:ATP-dependent Clp protease ATP-binding subunit ClpX
VMVIFDRLEADDLYEILRNPNGPIIQTKKHDFRSYGIDIRFQDEALRLLAKRAAQEKTGARGLVSVVEKVLMRFEKKLPSTNVKRLVVDEELVRNPGETLQRIVANPEDPDLIEQYEQCIDEERQRLHEKIYGRLEDYQKRFQEVLTERRIEMVVEHVVNRGADLVRVFEDMARIYRTIRFHERRFFERFDLRITLDDGAVDRIIEKCLLDGGKIGKFMEELLGNYEHGLHLIQEKTGQDEFILTREAVDAPEEYLNNLIREYYSQF